MVEGSFPPLKISILEPTFADDSTANILNETNISQKFTELKKNTLTLGFQSKPVWLRLEAKNQLDTENVIFDLGNSSLDIVNLYEQGNTIPIKSGGDFYPHADWDVFSKTVAFKLTWPKEKDRVLYLEIKSSSNISYSLRFFDSETYFQKESIENLVLGFFYGTIMIMVLYNLFIYFILKDRAYILYSLSIFFNLCLQIYLNGILNQHITLFLPELHNRIGSIILCLSASSGWMFAIETLQIRFFNPLTYKVLVALIFLTLFYLVFPLYFLPLNVVVRFGNVIAQVFVLSVFAAAWQNLRSGNKQAKLFLVGWSTLLLGILLYTLQQNGLFPANIVTLYSNQIGSTLEAGILSLALANKINQLKEEKVKAQEDALQTLETKVRERTQILDESLFNIRKDLSIAKKIQQTFFSEIRASDPRIKFQSFYQSMSEVGGDFYDMTQVTPDHYRLFVADATGHGIQAALITMAIKAEYESLKVMYDHPNDLIYHLNQIFLNKYSNVQTIFSCAVCDLDLKKGKLYYSSAGHPDQIMIRAGEKRLFSRTGRILGMVDHTEYKMIEHYIEEGDRIFLFTDGAFEQFNSEKEIFGEDRLYESLIEGENIPLEDSIQLILKRLNQFTSFNTHQDDITIVGCEIGKF